VCSSDLEQDFYWDNKPVSDGYNASGLSCFICRGIPEEFNHPITCGNLNLYLHRHAYGIKIFLEEEKYVLVYPRTALDKLTISRIMEKRKPDFLKIEEDFGKTIFNGNPKDIEKFFVGQFFRHVEYFPKLREKIYATLRTLSSDARATFLHEVGKAMTYGSELNFKRSLYLPIECITSLDYLCNYPPHFGSDKGAFYSEYDANHFFNNPYYKSHRIEMSHILDSVKTDNHAQLKAMKEKTKQLFQSARFIRHLLEYCPQNTETRTFLEKEFNECLAREATQRTFGLSS
jgi:hypothetical protein